MNILIIGAGVHGSFLSLYLNNKSKKNNITILEKQKSICSGSSESTHNRSNRGFHYPRSNKTAIECKLGWNFFYKNYKKFFTNIGYSYYIIEKKSLVSFNKYQKFLKENKYQFKKKFPHNLSFKKNKVSGSFEVFEGCFDHLKLKRYLSSKLKNNNKIKLLTNFEVTNVTYDQCTKFLKIKNNNNKLLNNKFDYIINCTYENTNKVDRIFGFKSKKYQYKIQHTLIAIVKTKKEIPGFTIMDGPFITILPRTGFKDNYLIYDPINSVSLKKINKANCIKRYQKMIIKLQKYINLNFEFKFVGFIKGKRPIPLNNIGDRRSTIIEKKRFNNINYINIREGKYISAPIIAKNLADEIL